MRHLEPDLERSDVRQGTRIPPGVNLREFCWRRVGNESAVGQGEIEDGKIAMLMAHGRTQPELKVDRDRGADHDAREIPGRDAALRRPRAVLQRRITITDGAARRPYQAEPEPRRGQSDDDQYSEKCLRHGGVEDPDLVFQKSHAQPSENSLKNHRAECGKPEVAQPAPMVRAPDPNGENDGEEADCRRDQPVGVLEENSADPFGNREKKHVVAERGRPVRNGETDAFAGDHSTAANEKERGNKSEPGEAMEPGVTLRYQLLIHAPQRPSSERGLQAS